MSTSMTRNRSILLFLLFPSKHATSRPKRPLVMQMPSAVPCPPKKCKSPNSHLSYRPSPSSIPTTTLSTFFLEHLSSCNANKACTTVPSRKGKQSSLGILRNYQDTSSTMCALGDRIGDIIKEWKVENNNHRPNLLLRGHNNRSLWLWRYCLRRGGTRALGAGKGSVYTLLSPRRDLQVNKPGFGQPLARLDTLQNPGNNGRQLAITAPALHDR